MADYINDPDKPSQPLIVAAKPKLLLKLVLSHNQSMECKTSQYTSEELDKLIGEHATLDDGPLTFAIEDENDQPGLCRVMRPYDILGYFILDFESYVRTVRAQQIAMARARGQA